MAYNFKKYEELTIWDDFMFAKTMKNQKLCKRLLEVVLGTEIERIEYPEEQKNIHIRRDAKWRVEYMTLEMRERERFKEGRAEGRAEVLYVLVQKGIIQIEDAAEELNVSTTEVEADMQKKGYRVPASL